MAIAHHPRGFTLTEMAIVLFIVSLLMGSLLMPLAAQQEIRQRQATDATLAEIKQALIGFALINKRLPRPAKTDLKAPPDVVLDGSEKLDCKPDLMSDGKTPNPEADCFGFIPWSVLGTARTDAWGKLIRYRVNSSFATNGVQLDSSNIDQRPLLRILGNNGSIIAGGTDCTTGDKVCIPVVIYSQGKLRGGRVDGGPWVDVETGTNSDEVSNSKATTDFVSREPTENTVATGGEFDDVVVWIPITTLFAKVAN